MGKSGCILLASTRAERTRPLRRQRRGRRRHPCTGSANSSRAAATCNAQHANAQQATLRHAARNTKAAPLQHAMIRHARHTKRPRPLHRFYRLDRAAQPHLRDRMHAVHVPEADAEVPRGREQRRWLAGHTHCRDDRRVPCVAAQTLRVAWMVSSRTACCMSGPRAARRCAPVCAPVRERAGVCVCAPVCGSIGRTRCPRAGGERPWNTPRPSPVAVSHARTSKSHEPLKSTRSCTATQYTCGSHSGNHRSASAPRLCGLFARCVLWVRVIRASTVQSRGGDTGPGPNGLRTRAARALSPHPTGGPSCPTSPRRPHLRMKAETQTAVRLRLLSDSANHRAAGTGASARPCAVPDGAAATAARHVTQSECPRNVPAPHSAAVAHDRHRTTCRVAASAARTPPAM